LRYIGNAETVEMAVVSDRVQREGGEDDLPSQRGEPVSEEAISAAKERKKKSSV
jgi:hypothetical protein